MKRLNFKLALWIVGVTVFSVVGVHFLHAYQLDRNAVFLRLQAEAAREEGNPKEAIKQYNQYLKHRDDPEAYTVLAELVVDIANDTDSTRQDKVRAYMILEEAIRRHQDLDVVRRQLIDYTIRHGGFHEAIDHIQFLANKGIKGPDLDFKLAQCYLGNREEEKAINILYGLVGYDVQTGQFFGEAPPGADEPETFQMLALMLRRRPDGMPLATQVMSQLVKWNDTAKAHLLRAAFQQSALMAAKPDSPESKEAAEAMKSELDKAYAQDSDNSDVLLASAVYAMAEKDYTKAQDLLDRALKEYPTMQDVYIRLSELKLRENNQKEAAEQLQAGLKKATEVNKILERLIDVQFNMNDLPGARETAKIMREKGTFPQELLRFEDARLKFAEGDFLQASRDFEAARPGLLRNPSSIYTQLLDLLLGHCYELLGQWDRELEVYRNVLQKQPDHLVARLGEATALQNLGRYEDAETSVNLLAANAHRMPHIRQQVLQLLMTSQMQKPEAQRDWSTVEEVAAMLYEESARPELDKSLLRAELLNMQGETAEAQKVLTAVCKQSPKDLRPWIALGRLLMRDNANNDRVTRLFKVAQDNVGDVAALRVERMRHLLRQPGEPEKQGEDLKKLEEGFDKFSEREQTILMNQFAMGYMQLRDYENTKRCLKFAVKHDPTNSGMRQMLFELAFGNADEATFNEVVKELYSSPTFGPQSPLYKYCAAAAKLYALNVRKKTNTGPLTPQERVQLTEARKLIDDGLAQRSEWASLWRLKGESEELENEPNAVTRAIAAYQRALECSHANQAPVARRLVHLLYRTNRISEANEVLKYAGQSTDGSDIWRRTVEDITFQKGDTASALSMAEKDVEEHPDSPAALVWYGSFLERAGRFDEAEASYRKACDVAPEMAQSWDFLVRRLMASKKKTEANEAVRDAAKALAKNPAGLAKLYEHLGDFSHAESYYKSAVQAKPDDLMAVKQLIEFYFNTNQQGQAMPYLDQVIQKTGKSTDSGDKALLWGARRFKATVLASVGDYEHILEATKLIEQNAPDGALSSEDAAAIVTMLASRPESDSRVKATQLLEKMQAKRALTPREQAVLGHLYERSGRWEKGKDLLLNAVGRKNDDIDILYQFSQLLIRHREYEEAERWVARLEELVATATAPMSPSVRQVVTVLRARLLVESGQKDEAVNLLETMLPRPLPPNQVRLLWEVSRMMEELELYDAAERLLAEYVTLDPRGAAPMAAFVARRGDVAKSFTLLEQARKSESATALLPVALEALRRNPNEQTKERLAIMEGWAKSGIEEDSNSSIVKMLLSELYSMEGRDQDAGQVLRDMLADPQMGAVQKAQIKNNLAFLLATSKPNPEAAVEAVKLVTEAIRVLGPTPDLLDTRAVALMAQGKTQQAIADLNLAISDNPSKSKYFHMAQAQKLANNLDAARASIVKAQEPGIDDGMLGSSEHKVYKQLVDELK